MADDYKLKEIDQIVKDRFFIEDTTYGSGEKKFLIRYRGKPLSDDFEKFFNEISDFLAAYEVMPLFQKGKENQFELFILPKLEQKKTINPNLNLVLFILTLLSVLVTGGMYGFQGDLSGNILESIWALIKNGWFFAVSLLAILGAHEFGHYFAGRKNDVHVTLPFFIPFPLSLFGTMGAFINMRSLPKNKKELFDLAITGPLSGAVISIIVLIIGLQLSELNTIPMSPPEIGALQMEGNSLLYLLMKYLSFGELLPNPAGIQGLDLFIYWMRYFFTGQPFPWGALDVSLHQVAWAGWAGLLVTGLNLIPAGQLDGGHIFYALFGKKISKTVFPLIVGLLFLLGFAWGGWWLWAVLIFFLGRRYAEPLDRVTELDSKRKWLGYLALVLFFFTFVPVPITIAGF